jgi:hypothetical protein
VFPTSSYAGAYAGAALALGACAIETVGLKTRRNDAGSADATVRDARARDGAVDARPDLGDAAPTASCAAPDTDVLGLFPFDPDDGTLNITDVALSHDGMFEGSPEWADGPPGCGRAPGFVAGTGTYGVIPHGSDWDRTLSVDLWIRWDGDVPLGPGGVAAILSRDANGTERSGHFGLVMAENGELVVRIQASAHHFLCSDAPVVPGRWTHVGINFGAPAAEMWVDGVRSTRTDTVRATFGGTLDRECNRGTAPTIAGNENPWVIAMGTGESAEGSATPVQNPFAPGVVDHLRISDIRRDFAVDR